MSSSISFEEKVLKIQKKNCMCRCIQKKFLLVHKQILDTHIKELSMSAYFYAQIVATTTKARQNAAIWKCHSLWWGRKCVRFLQKCCRAVFILCTRSAAAGVAEEINNLKDLQWRLKLQSSSPGEAWLLEGPSSPSTRAAHRCQSSPAVAGSQIVNLTTLNFFA